MQFVPKYLQPIVDFALPPRCSGCGVIVADDFQLCQTCWGSLDFLSGAGCELCGTPVAATALSCAPCMAHPPDHDGAHAAVAYGDTARKIILSLKHGRRIGLARLVARAMTRQLPDDHAILVPVPLHRWRIWSRGFNQSALIAAELARLSDHSLAPDLLLRTKATPLLRGLGARERSSTVRGAFALNPKQRESVRGKSIILIDDVYTSGATTNACARALKKAGVSKVFVMCWARVLISD
jgi:ComF family protein